MKQIFKDLEALWDSVDKENIRTVIDVITAARRNIVCIGAGRMGYAVQGFAMRLSHLGYASFMIGDTSLPRINKGDLVIINSSSGETESVVLLSGLAAKHGATLIVITCDADSTLGKMADYKITYSSIPSSQLMKSPYEQFTFLLLDYLSNEIFIKAGLERSWVEDNHSILE